FNAFANRKKK
ncbi:enoyl-CoA hydratase, partial [Bradyrhizobium sp. CCBAU 21359]|nr:enoyl-CoA hydratase [Bradyrhizobium sp. CCBAU 21359]